MNGEKIAILGTGSWGLALALHLGRKGYNPCLWSNMPDQIKEINENRTNEQFLPGIKIPLNIKADTDLERTLQGTGIILSAVPSHAFRPVLKQVVPFLSSETVLINAAKGIEEDSLKRMSQVYEELASNVNENYVAMSGPSHAEEVSRSMPTTVVTASANPQLASLAQEVMMSSDFRVYTNQDIVGVELGGSLKNIIALGAGIVDGLGFGDNAKAALMTRGLAEILRLGLAMGASPLTFAGLSGIGDLIVTCTSMHSRNRRAGIAIGKGRTPEQAQSDVFMVVEGVRTTKAAKRLADKHKVEMPITEQIYKVLFEGENPLKAVGTLMTRGKKSELEEIGIIVPLK